jgi:hypothetical protein
VHIQKLYPGGFGVVSSTLTTVDLPFHWPSLVPGSLLSMEFYSSDSPLVDDIDTGGLRGLPILYVVGNRDRSLLFFPFAI